MNIPNTIAGLSKKGEFVLIRFDETGIVNVEPIVPGFPKKAGALFSDNENNYICLVRGRGLYALDIESEINTHVILGNYGKTITTLVIDPEEKIMGATTLSAGAAYAFYAMI